MSRAAFEIKGCSNITIDNITVSGFENLCEVDNTSNLVVKNSALINSVRKKEESFLRKDANLKIDRNRKCICGSDKKYKKCCLKILQKFNLENSESICLLFGNGLNISAREYLKGTNQELNMDTYKFLSWDVKSPQEDIKFIEHLPILKKYLDKVDEKDDFKRINSLNIMAKDKIVEANDVKESFEVNMLLAEIKHYIAIAFSHFQEEFEKRDISGWEWTRFLKAIESKTGYMISLNYDLVLEYAMDTAKSQYKREGVRNERNGIGILKPHGSIDYEIEGISIPISYPMQNIVDNNDCPIIKLEKEKLLSCRKEVDIVLPMEYSYQTNYQWIKPGYEKIIEKGYEFTDLIICGVSYWECDRPEIDKIIDSFKEDVKVLIIDTNIKEDFRLKLYSKFGEKNVRIITKLGI